MFEFLLDFFLGFTDWIFFKLGIKTEREKSLFNLGDFDSNNDEKEIKKKSR